jgi:hypothetical protein
VCFATFYALLVQGERAYAYMEQRGPLSPDVTKRMSNAFYDAGRGRLVGTGLTALVQVVIRHPLVLNWQLARPGHRFGNDVVLRRTRAVSGHEVEDPRAVRQFGVAAARGRCDDLVIDRSCALRSLYCHCGSLVVSGAAAR